MPMYRPTPSETESKVWPSPIVTTDSRGAKGSNSWNLQTPLNASGSLRRIHFRSNSSKEPGPGSRSQS